MLTITIILILSVLVGCFPALVWQNRNKANLKLMVAFSGAYLFAVTVGRLLPEIYKTESKVDVSLFILLGFFIQVLLEFLSHGIEHGHTHTHEHKGHSVSAFTISIGLFLHAFFEGMPLAATASTFQRSLLAGIVLHNLPVGFAYAGMLLEWGTSKKRTILYMLLFALMSPLGMLSYSALGSILPGTDDKQLFTITMGIVVGIFLHISTTILYESSENHHFNRKKMMVIVLGIGLALISWL